MARRLILRAHKATWQSDPVWQGARENVERLTATRDWAEAFFATSVVYEPLLGSCSARASSCSSPRTRATS